MFRDKSIFTEISPFSNKISTSDPESNLICKGQGTVKIKINNKLFTLKNCLYVPKITKNLASLLDFCNKSITITKDDNRFHLSQNGRVLLSGNIINKLMIVTFNQPKLFLTKGGESPPWHQRLGHPGNQVLKSLGLANANEQPCNVCAKGKMTTLTFKGHFIKAAEPLDCLHLDVKCLMNLLFNKKLLENLRDRKIKRIVTDGGGEFVNQKFKDLANACGFTHVVAPPYTPEHNGFAKRANWTILDKAICLLLNSNLPNQYRAEAVNTATFLTNIIPTLSKNNYSPHYLWLKVPPKIRKIR
ncbi:hypothetical protein O181_074082 [Austropuccinia psidii MF-1]|uniref:Integrase catalytic domain-containing protein n=1 Tax=Austropuccinia psidii MF-1 TaxID=1389203 RepID=A0A9Q3FA93_9BASI|nr:hypothetical protein [Austropuccinia psidii MF-1]